MTSIRVFLAAASCVLLAACETSGTSSARPSSPMQRNASYSCSDGVSLIISRTASTATVSDSRGVEETLPASPPGQSARYAKDIYTLVIENGDILWYVLGKTPVDECRR